MIDLADRLAIYEVLALYGHLIDQRRFSELDQVFMPDLVFDATDMGSPRWTSRAELLQQWQSPDAGHPVAHHATNIVITEDVDSAVGAVRSDDRVRVMSKGIGMGPKGRIGSVTYHDTFVKTVDGWRMATRRVELRRPPLRPEFSQMPT